MLLDARHVPGGTELRAEVCVVGSGPAGTTVGEALRRRGVDVVVLESGGAELTAAGAELSRGESVGRPYYRLDDTRIRAFGGTSRHWHVDGYRSRPLDDLDLEAREPHGGWPFARRELDRYYASAHEVCHLSAIPYDDESWGSPLADDVARAWSGRLRPIAFRVAAGEPKLFLPYLECFAQDQRTRVVLNATVTDVELDPSRAAVASVGARTAGGPRFTVAADRFVLAAGGIENARWLLLNEGARPGGLANASDNVGRYFMEHLRVVPAILRLSDPSWRERLPSRDVQHGVLRYRHGLALHPDLIRREGLLNAAFYLEQVLTVDAGRTVQSLRALRAAPRYVPLPPDLGDHVRNVVRHPAAVAAHLRRRRHRHLAVPVDALLVAAVAEQGPNRASRVTLGARRDAFGQPVARLDWRTTDADLASVRRSFALLEDALVGSGAGSFTTRSRALFDHEDGDALFAHRHIVGEYHHMGTTRMHPDPRHGVVDVDCRVHGVRNLYVAGSSVFPTSGHANPTLTIVALALRLADHLAAEGGRRSCPPTAPVS